MSDKTKLSAIRDDLANIGQQLSLSRCKFLTVNHNMTLKTSFVLPLSQTYVNEIYFLSKH